MPSLIVIDQGVSPEGSEGVRRAPEGADFEDLAVSSQRNFLASLKVNTTNIQNTRISLGAESPVGLLGPQKAFWDTC